MFAAVFRNALPFGGLGQPAHHSYGQCIRVRRERS